VIFGDLIFSASFLRRPSSNAAIIEIALASPIPLNFKRSLIDNLPIAKRSLFTEAKTRLDKSTADSFLDPEPIIMASNSALVSAALPFTKSFSLGRSSSAQDEIAIFLESGHLHR